MNSYGKCRLFIGILAVLQLCSTLWALPTTAYEAEMVVTGWLKADPQPLGAALGRQVMTVEAFTDEYGEPCYYIVYLHPSGFVIVSADNMVEPIIGFADDGTYDPSPEEPLGALVANDLNGRITAVRNNFSPLAVVPQMAVGKILQKWSYFIGLAETLDGGIELMGMPTIWDGVLSAVRVAPLLQSKWGQSWYYDRDGQARACYNYYTPQLINGRVTFVEGSEDNYPCGCVATAMAQLMRYHAYPVESIEPKEFEITVDGRTANRWLLRGQGPDGAYNWDDMPSTPGAGTTDKQRQAIGALCHDAGIAVRMDYTSDGSGATLYDAATALTDTFAYDNAVWGELVGNVMWSQNLPRMMNPNLDAGLPVILGFRDSPRPWRGHAAVCDGYGYSVSTLYHHLNMGWEGQNDCWYNLPDINTPTAGPFDNITRCIYNVFTEGTGEIISGRIIDSEGEPIHDAEVTVQSETGTDLHTAITSRKGIYALRGLASDSTYTITAKKFGYDFYISSGYDTEPNKVDTGTSRHGTSATGNRWGVNFVGYSNCDTISIGEEASSWDYPMHTDYHDSRTQVIYLTHEIGVSGTIAALALDVMKIPDGPMQNWTIRMKHAGMSEYGTCSLDATGWTVVYRRNVTLDDNGWQKFDFQTPFEYNGTDNLLVDFSHNSSSQSERGQCRSSSPGGVRSVHARSNSAHGNPLTWSGTTSPTTQCSNKIPNVRLMFCEESRVVGGDIKLTASDGRPGDHFGCSVAISGDYAIVGAYGDDNNRGSAYVFKREGTNWIQQAKLRMGVKTYFGYSVSMNGDYAIIGAGAPTGENKERNIKDLACGAYVFKRDGTSWRQEAELRASDSDDTDLFGGSVSIDGDYAIVGAPCDDEDVDRKPSTDIGSAYIFKRDGTNWIQQAKLRDSDGGVYFLGQLVSISGDYAIVASDLSGEYDEPFGPVLTFKRNGTSWIQQAGLAASDNDSVDLFGHSIAISDAYAIVGAPEGNGNGDKCGAAHLFKRGGTSWTHQAELTASDGDFLDFFGNSVAVNGDYIIVGAPDDDNDYKGRDSGSVYIFKRDGASWTQQAKLTALDGASDDRFGRSVAIDGNHAIIGAEDDDDMGRESGSAYVFRRIGTVWTP